MTLNEYAIAIFGDTAKNAIRDGEQDIFLVDTLFPYQGKIFPSYKNTLVDYLPFDYTQSVHGGYITGEIVKYIYDNFGKNELNNRLTDLSNVGVENRCTPLQNKVISLMLRYKYKWHALYESMLLDSEYNPLDNVEEHSIETVRRTPNLSFSESGNINHGQISVNNNETVGQKTISVSNTQGAQSNSTSETIGTHTDSKTFTNGATDITTTNEQGVYAFDDNTTLAKTGKDTSHVQTLAVTNGESDSYGAQSNSKSDSIGSRTDSGSETHSGQSNSSSSTTGSHTDTSTLTKSETGSEVTTYEKSRHGNIGVTMATQLIEAYRNLHYFDLVKIIANDIINEILDLNFFS